MIRVVRIYLLNGQSVLYRERKNGVVNISASERSVMIEFKNGTTREYFGLPFVLEEKLS
jgi:hypothetical protein